MEEQNQNFLKNPIIQDLLNVLGSNCPCSVPHKALQFQHLGNLMTLILRWIPLFNVEPIGGTKPKFSQESESSTFTKQSGLQLSLLCPAQGAPLPSFRFVSTFFYFSFDGFKTKEVKWYVENCSIPSFRQ